jgi:hypothetical protein
VRLVRAEESKSDAEYREGMKLWQKTGNPQSEHISESCQRLVQLVVQLDGMDCQRESGRREGEWERADGGTFVRSIIAEAFIRMLSVEAPAPLCHWSI